MGQSRLLVFVEKKKVWNVSQFFLSYINPICLSFFIKRKLKRLIFVKFHVPWKLEKNEVSFFCVIKIGENWSVWNFTKKNEGSDFCEVSCTRVMKLHKKQKLQFSPIFMTPGTWNFTKIKRFSWQAYRVYIRQKKLGNISDLFLFNKHQ